MSEIVVRAAELSPAEREEYIAEACGEDEALRREVESLLDFSPTAQDLLQRPVAGKRGPWDKSTEVIPDSKLEGTDLEAGRRVGSYRLLKKIGQGGMGTVFLAAREDDFKKRVALKLINTLKWPHWYHRERDGQDVVRRFHNERQILAQLEHPNIARILDGGTTAEGIPYFAMEYVDGVPIDEYCDANGLSTEERLRLILKVCDALQVAHQRLVVHRDLKPSNILVTAAGEPKLLDFGIAKRLAVDDDPGALATATGLRPMTLKYASPEQLLEQPITTASDTYALGVLLYQLLTGHSPYRLENNEFLTLARAICDQEPLSPSSAVMRSEDLRTAEDSTQVTPELVSATRDGTPRKLRLRLHGDLDSIVLKALAKEPDRRYGSLEQLADDLCRHLEGLPVKAREATLLYRGGKFVRRHLVQISIAAGMLVVLILGGVSQWEAHEAAHRAALFEEQAEDAANRTKVLADVFYDLLIETPMKSQSKALTAREFLDRGVELLYRDLVEEPQLLADQLELFGRLYGRMGLYAEAEEHLQESLRIRRDIYGGDHLLLARGLNNLAAWYYSGGQYGRAEEHYRAALAMKQELGQEGLDLVKVKNNLAGILVYRGKYEEAKALYLDCLELRQAEYGRNSLDVAKVLRNLGIVALNQGRLDRAQTLIEEVLEIRLNLLEPRTLQLASARSALGRVLLAKGELEGAERTFREVLAVRRELQDEGHHHVALTKKDLASVLLARGKLAPAGELLQEALTTLRRTRPEGAWEIVETESLWGAWLATGGETEEARSWLFESHRRLEELRGNEAAPTREARARLLKFFPEFEEDIGAGDE